MLKNKKGFMLILLLNNVSLEGEQPFMNPMIVVEEIRAQFNGQQVGGGQ